MPITERKGNSLLAFVTFSGLVAIYVLGYDVPDWIRDAGLGLTFVFALGKQGIDALRDLAVWKSKILHDSGKKRD